MGYLIRASAGLALFFGGIVLFNVKLRELLDVGTCSTGSIPFEPSPGYECPEGVGGDIMLAMASVLAALIGAAVFAFRGDPPWGRRRRPAGLFGLGTLAWGIFFAGTGAALLLGGPYGEITDPQTGETVGRAGTATAGGGSISVGGILPGTRAGGDQVIGKLERLQRLRESGALSTDEFEREKAKVLAER